MPISRRSILFLPSVFAFGIDSREPAPKFRAKSTTGQQYTNDSVKGKVVLIQFWTTWCPYCKRDLDAIESIESELRSQGLLVLAVNVAESKKRVQEYLKESPRSSPIVMMSDTNLAAMFAVKSFPYYVVIDRSGGIVDTQAGSGGEASLKRMLRKAGIGTASVDDAVEVLQASPRRD